MTRLAKRRNLVAVSALLCLAAVVLAFLLVGSDTTSPALFVIETGHKSQADDVLHVRLKNVSRDTLQYPNLATNGILPRCVFVQKLPEGEKRWESPDSSSSRFISPGEEIIFALTLPVDGPLQIGVLLRRLPHTRWTDNVLVRRIRQTWFMLRVKFASARSYEPYWIPETVVTASGAK